MASSAFVITRPESGNGGRKKRYIIGVEDTGGSPGIPERVVFELIEHTGRYDACSAAEKTALGAATVTAIRAVTSYHTKTEI